MLETGQNIGIGKSISPCQHVAANAQIVGLDACWLWAYVSAMRKLVESAVRWISRDTPT